MLIFRIFKKKLNKVNTLTIHKKILPMKKNLLYPLKKVTTLFGKIKNLTNNKSSSLKGAYSQEMLKEISQLASEAKIELEKFNKKSLEGQRYDLSDDDFRSSLAKLGANINSIKNCIKDIQGKLHKKEAKKTLFELQESYDLIKKTTSEEKLKYSESRSNGLPENIQSMDSNSLQKQSKERRSSEKVEVLSKSNKKSPDSGSYSKKTGSATWYVKLDSQENLKNVKRTKISF